MSADTKALRNRIKSVDSTLHLTKAMGLVASSKIKRALTAKQKGRQYADSMDEVIKILSASSECEKSPYMAKRDGGRVRIIIIAGDRGLAGGYNANIFRLAKQYEGADFIPIGKRACERYGKDLYLAETFSTADALEFSKKLCEDFCEGKYDRLGIIGTKYVSMMSQEAQIKWILPIEREAGKKSVSVLFEPDEITVLNAAMIEYLSGVIMADVRESFASEVAARRCAMDSAGKNAQEMIDDLQLLYNRARQGAITQELTEIVAGSNSQ